MNRLLFDENGEAWDEGSFELRRRLHCVWAGDELASRLVRNLGYVRLSYRRSSAIVEFRPHVVAEKAIGEAVRWLWDNRPERVLLTHFHDAQGHHEILTSASAVARRVGQITAWNTESDVFRSCRRDPRSLADDDSSLGALLELWRAQGETFDWSSHNDFLEARLGGHFVVLSAESPQSDLRIEAAGAGLRIPGSNWFADNVGASLSYMPDCFYRQRISRGYYATLRSGEPYAEEVEATIFWPRFGPVPRKYSRLILRCPGRHGRNALLCATRVCA